MKQRLYRLVYCSRNRIAGDSAAVAAEIRQILNSSRRNNSRVSITGALLYNRGNFAQVLEGPLSAIEKTFEVIQRDPRHSEVNVIQSGPIEQRDFPEWSMAFSGNSATDDSAAAIAAFDAVSANAEAAGDQMMSVLKDLVVDEDDWVLMDVA